MTASLIQCESRRLPHRALFWCGLVLTWCSMAVSAHGEVRIIRVEGVEGRVPNIGLRKPYMLKFAEPEFVGEERVVRVVWESDEIVPKGSLIIFEYRTAQKRDKVFFVRTERPYRGEQETVFRFLETDEMAAWRVRIAAGARTLGVRASANWR